MKLLGWVHRKFKQTNIEPFKDLITGNYCSCLSPKSTLDDYLHQRDQSLVSGYGSRHDKQSYEECGDNCPEIKVEGINGDYKDEISMMSLELFHGFLTIGTLGFEPITEPATPTFSLPSDTKFDVTETDLKLINEELEKFLEAEAEEEGYNELLGRSSYVSTITLSDIQMVGAKGDDDEKTVICPLQGYLFGSPIELPEATTRKEKVTLGEMFQRSKNQEDISAQNKEIGEKQGKPGHHSSKHFLKAILKKFSGSSRDQKPFPRDKQPNAATSRKKLSKILKMFCRKVQPENLTGKDEFNMSQEDKAIKDAHKGGYNPDFLKNETHKRELLPGFKSKEAFHNCKNKVEIPQYGLWGSNSGRNREHWIKTDADYLVLEL